MNILIIENSETLSQLLQKALSIYGYDTTLDTAEFESKHLVKKGIFDFLVLSTNLDSQRSFEILSFIKTHCAHTKVLGVCNKGSWVEKVDFLNHGGDDVLTYPFPIQELLARIQALMRRSTNYIEENLHLGEYVLDTDNKIVSKGNKDLLLRKREYSLFEYLLRNKDRAISRCELLDHVWDYREYVGSNTIDVHIKRLRDKLDDKSLIKTVHGVGYKIEDKPLKHHRHH